MMKRKSQWNVIIWTAMGDVKFRVFVQKPDWANIKPLINADMIEIQKGYDKDISDRYLRCFATKNKDDQYDC